MKKLNLKKTDYAEVADYALFLWKDRSAHKVDNFNVMCIVDSFIAFTKKHGIVVMDGEVYEKDEIQSKS